MRSLLLLLVFFAISICLAAPAPYAAPIPAKKASTTTTTKKTTTTTTTTKKTTTTTTLTNTKTTSTITVTASTSSATSSGGLTCGVAGYDKTSSYNYDGSGAYGNLGACSAKCNADSNCLSFAFGSGACLLYNVAAGGNVNAASGSPYLFYDKACVSASSTTTTTSPSTSSTSTSTTTSKTSTSSTTSSSTTSSSTSSSTTSSSTTSSTTTSSSLTSSSTTSSSKTSSSTSSSTTSLSTTSLTPSTTSSTTTILKTTTSTTSSTLASSTKQVYAHFIVGNAAGMSVSDWVSDINLAKSAHIDGFALDIAAGDTNTNYIVANAYSAAQSVGGFTLFLTFDYASWGAWSASTVIALVNQYKTSSAQAYYQGKPLVSTFEGTANSGDWTSIKSSTGCFFIPDWSSLGPSGFAPHLSDGTADGAFSWDAWPDGANDMTTFQDQSWKSVLGSKPFMMPVSPWFYTNLPQWSKNWLWRGDDMWNQRWQQVIQFQPELVQIITWNDYGESHYIGPTYSAGIPSGAWYVDGMPHTGWLSMLPYYIDAYKSGSLSTSGTAEKISYWYKLNPGLSGSGDGTTGNNPSYQTAVSPELVTTDKIFLDVLVSAPSTIVVTVGSNTPTILQATAAGISHFSVPYGSQVGAVTMQITRNGAVVASVTGPAITASCTNGDVNWNAYVGSS